MSSSLSFDEIDLSEAAFDTSVLLNYTLSEDDGQARRILSDDTLTTVVSKNVKREYKKVKENRKEAIRSMLKTAGEGSLRNWEPPRSLGLSGHDRNWCINLHNKLCEMDSEEKVRVALEEANRVFNRGYRTLFTGTNNWISDILPAHSNPLLVGYLCNIENHHDDMVILADTAAWSADGGSGTLITSDQKHMLESRENLMDVVSRNNQVDEICLLSTDEFLDFR